MISKILTLSEEQEKFIDIAQKGHNILVNACIGSGKTTAIQHLCEVLPFKKRILYLTYNRLLKIDAKSKIHNKNVTVTNYHGFAFSVLKHNNISAGVSDLIEIFNKNDLNYEPYDILLIDEFQDIDLELSEMLWKIKSKNPQMQIIAVGDMCQKIYDKTTLNVEKFIDSFLESYIILEFTQCFRLGKEYANKIGAVWNKNIVGVNNNSSVTTMEMEEVEKYISNYEPKDLLCLGSRNGDMTHLLNSLEEHYPSKFNKYTVYASIEDDDSGKSDPNKESAIFTTYDSSKGLERRICILFDFTEVYWSIRANKPQQSYEILKNIFCVAASRGKEKIIFVHNKEKILSFETIAIPIFNSNKISNIEISEMFDFKYKESIEKCYKLLNCSEIETDDKDVIDLPEKDGLIDLSPCIGIYQEKSFFINENIEKDFDLALMIHPEMNYLYTEEIKNSSLEKKILCLTSIETKQNRYINQVQIPYVSNYYKDLIHKRLLTVFNYDEIVQQKCEITFAKNTDYEFVAHGFCDVLKNNIVYELKFVSELKHDHFLQCACYMVALNKKEGILWNIKNNKKYLIKIPSPKLFLDSVCKTVLKKEPIDEVSDNIAIIDTETTFSDKVMSIGVVISNKNNYEPINSSYYVLSPEFKEMAMFRDYIYQTKIKPQICNRVDAIQNIEKLLKDYQVGYIFAYNAYFDYNHLPELQKYQWFDIMKLAAYKQYNRFLSDDFVYCNTGRLKKNYGVESIFRLLSNNINYSETHNAINDAIDELKIMKMLQQPLSIYFDNAIIEKKSVGMTTNKEINKTVDYFNKTETKNKTITKSRNIVTVEEAARIINSTIGDVQFLISKKKLMSNYQDGITYVTKKSIKLYLQNKKRKKKLLIMMLFTIIFFIMLFIMLFRK